MQCPSCNQDRNIHLREPEGDVACGVCGWHGIVHQCHPVVPSGQPEPASPNEAVCANHPENRAVAVCAATGDFVCELCRVHVDGQDYSIDYLDRKGEEVFDDELFTHIPRPDRTMAAMVWIGILLPFTTPLVWFISTMAWRRSAQLRRQSPAYRLASAGSRPRLSWIILTLVTVVVCGAFVYFAVIGPVGGRRVPMPPPPRGVVGGVA